MNLGSSLVTYRPPLCRIGCNLLVRKSLWMHLLGPLLQSVGSVSSREIFTTLKSKVARSFVSVSVLNSSCIAEPHRCDPKRGQRGGQCGSFSSSNGSSVAGACAGRSAGLCLSSRIIPTILSSTCSSSAGNLASGSVDVDRAGAVRSEVGESLLALDRSGAPGRVGGGRVGAARRFRAGSARGKAGEFSLALNRQACRKRVDSSGSATDFDSAFIPYARSFSLHPSLVSNNSCGVHGVGAMNSCGSMHVLSCMIIHLCM